MSEKKLLPKKTDDISEWYTSVIQLADLADYGPVKGTMIIKPYGYAMWELLQAGLDKKIKARGVGNAYFPIFIPMSFLEKEKSHVEGFAPELAVVTHGGGEELEESLAVRPTSETIMYNSYSKWIQSWRDLPMMMNQWNNVVRWEKRTMPFLRTSEFLWQEGHTAHADHAEAIAMQDWAMMAYEEIYRDYLAIDGYIGYKSTSERFAGANTTLTYEALMPSGKALQACTSHDLGQNFSEAFDISFQGKDGQNEYVWQTSWGLSTRSLGGLFLTHGDDSGLIVPPKMAPTQVVIVPAKLTEEVSTFVEELRVVLADNDVRVVLDGRDDESFGFKLNKWEVKGVPLILKVGPKEVEQGVVTVKRRDTGEEKQIDASTVASGVDALLETIQADLFAASRKYKEENTRTAETYDEFKQIMETHKGFIRVYWNDNPEIEAKIKQETTATSRCCLREAVEPGVDFYTGEPADTVWIFGQSY